MQISELAARSGVSIATIKFYLREGLLPAGEAVSRTRAAYGEAHVRRLRLIRALLELGGVQIAGIRRVIEAASADLAPHDVFREAYAAIGGPRQEDGEALAAARASVDHWVESRGLAVSQDAPARSALAECLAALRVCGLAESAATFDRLAELLAPMAVAEISSLDPEAPIDSLVETVVVATVVYERALGAVRRLLLESGSKRVFGQPVDLGRPT